MFTFSSVLSKSSFGSVCLALISLSSNSWRSKWFVCSRKMVLKMESLHKLLQNFWCGLFWHLDVICTFSGANGRGRHVLQVALQPKIRWGQHVLWSKSVREWLQRRSISVIFRFNSRFFIDVYGGLIEHCGCCLQGSWPTFRLAEVRRFKQWSHKSAQLLYGEYIQQWVTLYSKHQGWTQYRCKQYVTEWKCNIIYCIAQT